MKLTLVSIKREAEDINSYIFESEMPISWIAGQYLIYSLPHENQDLRGKMRFFTISSSPFEKNPSITTKIEKNSSSFKNALGNLKIGDFLEAKGPDGDLTIEDKKRKYIFIAGGMGITPFRSIIRELNHKKLPINVKLLYANKNSNFLFKEELEEISQNNSSFEIKYFIRPRKVTKKDIKDLNVNVKKSIFYISGAENMIYKIKDLLASLGVKDEQMKEDYFTGYKKI